MTTGGRMDEHNGHTIYKCDLCQVWRSSYASFTRMGNTYTCISISGLANT